MSDENQDQGSVETGSPVLPSVGSQLKAAREARQMTVNDIALALKLGAKQVEALESGNWQGLPGHTFIRGFVRNYARLLQTDPTPLMAQLDGVLESPQQRLTLPGQSNRHVAMPQSGRPKRRDYAMVILGILLVVVAAGVYFLLPSDLSVVRSHVDSVVALFSKKEAGTPPAPAAAPQSEPVFPPGTTPQQVMNPQAVGSGEAASAPPSPPALVPPPVQQGASAQPAPEPSPAPQPAAAAPAATNAETGKATLHFSFEQESWVEVRDRKGKVIFSQRNQAGTEKNIEGQGPFSLVIGNAPGVKLSLRGRPVELESSIQGNVARLTLE